MGRLWWVAACAALWACNDGGNNGGGGGSNGPPAFTSASSASVPEGSTAVFYTAAASDPDGDPLSFSIAGGPDAGAFTINAGSGGLSFASAPDFEAPADANGDNVYEVTLQVSDGAASATLALRVTVTNQAGGLVVRRVGTGFTEPVFLAGLTDGSGRVYVVERGGRILILDPATGLTFAEALIDLTNVVDTGGEGGLLGFALAPDFAASGQFYVNLVTRDAFDTEIRRYDTVAGNRNRADPNSADVILTFEQPATNHNGGWIGFGPDNLLYIPTGDGGDSGDPGDNAQNVNSLLGKVLRIDVGGDQFPADPDRDYLIPAGNPFAAGGGAPEVWALGLRNPFRASFDPSTGDLFIGDVGQGAIEEVDRLRSTDGGANLGWRFFEGTQAFTGTPPGGFQHFVPVTQYAHGTGPLEGRTVIGGYVYRGPIAALQGQYVFGDFISGNLWSVPETALTPGSTLPASQFTQRNADFTPEAGRTIDMPVSFGTDAQGALYIVDYDGEIFRVEEID